MKKRFRSLLRGLQVLAAATIPLASAQTAQAATFVVTNNTDGNTDTSCTAEGTGDGCNLREAIAAANANTTDADTITFAPNLAGASIGLLRVGDGDFGPSALGITGPLVIQGPTSSAGVTITRGNGAVNMRLFAVKAGGSLTLRDLTLRGGLARGGDGGTGAGSGGGAAGLGGAVFNAGTLSIERSTLSGNQAVGGSSVGSGSNAGTGGGGLGGGGAVGGTASGTAGGGPNGGSAGGFGNGGVGGFGGGGGGTGGNNRLAGAGGFGGGGGGAFGAGTGAGAVGGAGGFGGGGGGTLGNPSTIGVGGFGGGNGTKDGAGNAGGGGTGLGGAIFNFGATVTLTNSTFSGNTAQGGTGGNAGQGLGGGLFARNGTNTIDSCTFSDNTAAQGGGGVYFLGDGGRVTASYSNSIFANTTGGASDLAFTTTPGGTSTTLGNANLIELNAVGANSPDPNLGPLQNNGGPTQTYAPNAGSPAINAGSTTLAVDQRGAARTGVKDIGAFEVVADPTGASALAVTTTRDDVAADGLISLREAINTANGNANPNVTNLITFATPLFGSAQTITLSRGELGISSNITIDGPDAAILTVSGNNASRVFNVRAGTSTLDDLVIADGNSGSTQRGGCISNQNATLSLLRCVVTGGASETGGGIYNLGATLNLTNCTLVRNTVVNTGTSIGGALYNITGGTANLLHCTITNNSADRFGAGIMNSGTLNLGNSIVAGNAGTRAENGRDIFNTGTLTSQGYNLIGIREGGATFASTDQSGTAAAPLSAGFELDANNNNRPFLKDNGGGTLSIALLINSPAVNAGSSTATEDQRGVARPQAGRDDIGAYELVFTPVESLIVTTIADEDNGTSDARVGSGTSLREAINYAKTTAGADTITFAVTGTILLQSQLLIDSNAATSGKVTITGPSGGIAVSGDANNNGVSDGGDVRVFFVEALANVALNNLTIERGLAPAGTVVGGGGPFGGGIANRGTLAITGCTLRNNSASGGGAIQSQTESIEGNPNPATRLTVVNCTFSGNTGGTAGGAIRNTTGLIEIRSSTIVGNFAPSASGVSTQPNSLTRTVVGNTIIADNRVSGGAPDSGDDVRSGDGTLNTFVSEGYNLIGDGNSATDFSQSTDRTGVTASQVLVGELADNEGPTPTRALLPGSIAIDAGDPAITSGTDQTGLPRVKRGRADVGAFEVQNERPSSAPITKSTDEDQILAFVQADFTAAYSDPENDALNFVRITALPTRGTLKLGAANVTLNQDIAAANLGTLTYTPNANISGTDSFGYASADLYGPSAASTVTTTIAPIADTPSVTNASTSEDTQTTSGLVITRNAADGAEVTHFQITGITNGALFQNDGTTDIAEGAFITFAQGNAGLKFTPAPNFNGIASFDVQASTSATAAGLGGSKVTATVTISAVNDTSVLAGIESSTLVYTEGDSATPLTGTLTVADADDSLASATVSITGGFVSGEDFLVYSAQNGISGVYTVATGVLTLSGTATPAQYEAALRSIQYTQPRSDNPTAGDRTVSFQVSDGVASSNVATRTVRVVAVNDGPRNFVPADTQSTNEDTALVFSGMGSSPNGLLVTDSDTVALMVSLSVSHGTLTLSQTTGLTFSVGDGTADATMTLSGPQRAINTALEGLVYAPATNYNGSDVLTLTTSDGSAPAVTDTVSITINPLNDAPVALSQSLAATTRAVLPITLTATDVDTAQSGLTFTLLSQPTNGTLSGSGANLRYTARPGFSGTDSFTFRASDGALTSNVATITLRVSDTNRAPIAQADSASTAFNTPVTVQVLGNDSDADGDTLSIASVDAAGTRGTLSLSVDKKSITFTPESGFSGSTSFGYTVSDGVASSSARVTVDVAANPTIPNRAPVAVADSYSARGPLQVLVADGVLKNDSDADGQVLTAILQSTPGHGELKFNRDGSFVYTPAVGYAGRDSFTYLAFDGTAQSATVAVSLQVASAPDVTAPVLKLAGGALRVERQLIPLRGSAADVYVLKSGAVVSSGLQGVTVQLRRSNGDYWNGRTYQKVPFNLPVVQQARSFFTVPSSVMPPLSQAPGGRYLWTATATDNAGNVSRAQQFMLVDVTAPSLVIATPAAGNDGVARVTKLDSVNGRASEAAKIDLILRRADGQFWNGRSYQRAATFLSVRPVSNGAWSFPASALPSGDNLAPGRYTITIRATDGVGNVGTTQRVVEVASAPAG